MTVRAAAVREELRWRAALEVRRRAPAKAEEAAARAGRATTPTVRCCCVDCALVVTRVRG